MRLPKKNLALRKVITMTRYTYQKLGEVDKGRSGRLVGQGKSLSFNLVPDIIGKGILVAVLIALIFQSLKEKATGTMSRRDFITLPKEPLILITGALVVVSGADSLLPLSTGTVKVPMRESRNLKERKVDQWGGVIILQE